MWKVFSFLCKMFGRRSSTGSIVLVLDGHREIEIKPGFTPKEVWLRPMEPKCVPVCLGNCDAFDVKIVPHGFVLIANLSSEIRELQWIAVR